MRRGRAFWTLAAGVAGIVIGVSSNSPVNTQERGTPVIVANTPDEPVPVHVTNPLPLNVCPVSCGAYQVQGAGADSGSSGASVTLDVPPGTRFTIRHVSVEVMRPVGGSVSVQLRTAFLPQGAATVELHHLSLPLQHVGTFANYLKYHGSFPVHVYHDAVDGPPLRFQLLRSGISAGSMTYLVLVSGNLEPLP